MSKRAKIGSALAAVLLAATAFVAAAANRSSTPSSSAGTPATALGKSRASTSSTSAKASRGRPAIAKVINTFAGAYATYLNGGPATPLADTSITANGQAHQGGRIPARFRDGSLHISSESPLRSTCCSAQQTVVLANRQESYPFTVTVLDDGLHGWQVASLVPVDLAMDRHTQPVRGFALPAAAKRAARRFAVAYATYKAGVGAEPTGMTSAAIAAITNGQDSLADQTLPRKPARLAAISFGPPTGNKFATTATVSVGSSRQSFSYLMTLSAGRWLAAAFL